MIRGALLSTEEGSTLERVIVGFGSGSSHLSVAVEGYQMTAQGLRRLGSATLEAGGGTGIGTAPPLASLMLTGNPLGLIVGSGIKAYGELSGRRRIEGRADQAAKTIANGLKSRFREQGWIQRRNPNDHPERACASPMQSPTHERRTEIQASDHGAERNGKEVAR